MVAVRLIERLHQASKACGDDRKLARNSSSHRTAYPTCGRVLLITSELSSTCSYYFRQFLLIGEQVLLALSCLLAIGSKLWERLQAITLLSSPPAFPSIVSALL
jgi:hypothetical protein